MTAPTTTTATVSSTRPVGQPPLGETASIVTGGTLAWLGWLWVVVGIVFAIALGTISVVGELDSSLWHDAVAGWQRWVLVGAGATTAGFFLRTLVGNGVTRARLAASTTIALVVLAVLGATFILVGYLVEELVFGLNDWRHVVQDGTASLDGFGDYGEVFVDHLLTLAAYYATGWLIGICWFRWRVSALPAFVVCLVPAVTAELFLRGESGAEVVDGWDFDPPLVVGVVVVTAVIAAGCRVAARLSRELEVC